MHTSEQAIDYDVCAVRHTKDNGLKRVPAQTNKI